MSEVKNEQSKPATPELLLAMRFFKARNLPHASKEIMLFVFDLYTRLDQAEKAIYTLEYHMKKLQGIPQHESL